jgi:hypothetical protein
LLLCVDLFQKWPVPEDMGVGAEADHFRLDFLDCLRRETISSSSPDGWPMLVLSEIRKDEPQEITLNDLKGDGRMTSDADCVLLMFPSAGRPASDHLRPMTIRIAKGRDGVNRSDILVNFDFEYFRFLECAASTAGGLSGSARTKKRADSDCHESSSYGSPATDDLDPLAT